MLNYFAPILELTRTNIIELLSCVISAIGSMLLLAAIITWTRLDANYVILYGIVNQSFPVQLLTVSIVLSTFFTACLLATAVPCQEDIGERICLYEILGVMGIMAGSFGLAAAGLFVVINVDVLTQLGLSLSDSFYLACIGGGFQIITGISYCLAGCLTSNKRKVASDLVFDLDEEEPIQQSEATVLINKSAFTEPPTISAQVVSQGLLEDVLEDFLPSSIAEENLRSRRRSIATINSFHQSLATIVAETNVTTFYKDNSESIAQTARPVSVEKVTENSEGRIQSFTTAIEISENIEEYQPSLTASNEKALQNIEAPYLISTHTTKISENSSDSSVTDSKFASSKIHPDKSSSWKGVKSTANTKFRERGVFPMPTKTKK